MAPALLKVVSTPRPSTASVQSVVSDFGSSLPGGHAACRSNAGVVREIAVKYHGLDAPNHAAQAAPEIMCIATGMQACRLLR